MKTLNKNSDLEIHNYIHQLEIFARSGHEFNAELNVSIILKKLVLNAIELTGASDGCAGLLINDKVVFTKYFDQGKEIDIYYDFPKGYGVPGFVFETKKPYITRDATTDPHVIPEIQKELGFLTLVDVPILTPKGDFIGCLEIHKKNKKDYFRDFDINLLLGLATSAAVAIENTRILEKSKISEKFHKEDKERLQQITDNMAEVFWLIELATMQIIYVSNAFEKIWQKKCEDLYKDAKLKMKMIHTEDRDRVDEAFNAMIESGEFKEEYRIIRKDGSQRWISDRGFTIRDENGKLIRLAGIAEDITEKKLIEVELRQSDERYKQMMLQSPAVMELYDMSGLQIDVNTAYEELWGFPASTTVNNFNVLKSKEVVDTGLIHFINRAYAGEAVRLPEYQFNPKGETESGGFGRVRWLSTRIYPIKNKDGKVINIIITHEDVSDRKYAEIEKVDLELKMQRLKNMELLGTIAGGVAHDLNNILTPLVGYPDLLLDQIPANSPMRKKLLAIMKSGEKAAAIVQDLLTFTRRGVQTYEVVNLNAIINEQLESIEALTFKKRFPKVSLEVNYDEFLLNIMGSPIQLSKAIMNLISNAYEAVSSKNGKVNVSVQNCYLDHALKGFDKMEEGEYVLLKVSDNGSGISKEDLPKIFEPFYTKKNMGKSGTGLGMTIVYGTIVDHKGYINVESTIDEGTTFSLYFPITRVKQNSKTKLESFNSLKGNLEEILVIDDVKHQRILTESMLSSLNYKVSLAASGEEAIEFLKSHKVDLIILDMIMEPGIDGLETYKKILEIHPKQKAIIASGYSETDRVQEAQRLGACEYIKKPFIRKKIGTAIKNELNR